MIATEVTLPPATVPLDPVTVTVAEELTGPLNAVALAVMAVVPDPTAVARPEELIVAAEGLLEVHVTALVITWVLG
jgi:hypothetical protein